MILSSILIVILCSALLAYWFRFSCAMLLQGQARLAESYTPAMQGTFSFAKVQEGLRSGGELEPVHGLLERDYQVLQYLIRHASGLKLESYEERMLVWDYKVMRCCYRLTRTAAPEQARRSLAEMCAVLSVLAGRIGQRAGLAAQA